MHALKSVAKNAEFRKIMMNLSVRKRRDEMQMIVLEGKRLINDAIKANVPIDSIYFTSESNVKEIHDLDRLTQERGVKLTKVLYKDMKLFSDLVTSPGFMAVAHRPTSEHISQNEFHRSEVPVTVICDNIRDPGNMGTIVRSAAASGIQQLITTSGTVDVWSPKVVKSGSGAHFRLPIHVSVAWEDLYNEIPSLKGSDFYLADANLKSQSKSYFDVSPFASEKPKNKVLIVCNEAHGPSTECEEFIHKLDSTNFTRIHIPLGSNVESLNSAVAASVFMFEFRKQFSQKSN